MSLVFPEGERAVDYARRLSQAGLDGEGFLRLVREPGALKPPYVAAETLEGYLFPATYTFDLLAGPEEVVRAMLRRFEAELTPPVRRLLEERGLSVHAWVTLASIVEQEAGSLEEMPYIAGVFLNRLERGMPLQA
ncbi:endolytic transglycosylase MltG, partial [Shewanella sp. C31]|nr:endolytic transglycosylase MltG [Shewanella electrica]